MRRVKNDGSKVSFKFGTKKKLMVPRLDLYSYQPQKKEFFFLKKYEIL